MSRYIDEISARENFQDVLAYMGSEVKRILKKVPTADVVEVRQVNNFIQRLRNIPGAIYHSELKQICDEFGFDYLGAKMDGERSEG